MLRFLIAALLFLTHVVAAQAQDAGKTMLVLDGSGSMWGQIGGVNKIVIAREVIAEALREYPADRSLGLTVYGHRREGDCNDIETLIASAPGTAAEVVARINAINPRGKTPISGSVMAAAEALNFTEQKATVILLSDGVETCQVDPCVIGPQLEEIGLDFTAHVIGFDVEGDAQAMAQLQCLADQTGGLFRTASNAEELAAAFREIALPSPQDPVSVTFAAIADPEGRRIADGVTWNVTAADGSVLLGAADGAAPRIDLQPGTYEAVVTRAADGASAATSFTVGDGPEFVTLSLPQLMIPVPVRFSATAGPGGPEIAEGLVWQLLDGADKPVLPENSATPTADLLPGEYSVEVTRRSDSATATGRFTVADAPLDIALALPPLTAPVEVTLNATAGDGGPVISEGLVWRLHDSEREVVLPSASVMSPTVMLMPGRYEALVRRSSDGAEAQVRFTVDGEARTVNVALPDLASEPVVMRFIGTDGKDGPRINQALTWRVEGEDGVIVDNRNALNLEIRLKAGSYLVSVTRPVDQSKFERIVEVGEEGRTVVMPLPEYLPTGSLTVPKEAPAGSIVQVRWDGPESRDDFITIAWPKSEVDVFVNSTYARNNRVIDLQLPAYPGSYEVRYILRDGRKVLDRARILVTPVEATVSHSGALSAGGTIDVEWTGPGYRTDYVATVVPGTNRWETYAYVRNGSPLRLKLPAVPGDYDLVYIMQEGDTVLARKPITVGDVAATLDAPAEATAGSTIEVGWTGPDYKDDYVAVVAPGRKDWITYAYTRQGAPLPLRMPSEPGTYELVYVMNLDQTVLKRVPIAITPASATIHAPESAAAGETLRIAWTGPGYGEDYIAVVRPGAEELISYSYLKDAGPVTLRMPAEAGAYELAYVMSPQNKVLTRTPVTVSAVDAEIGLHGDLVAGATVAVDWSGPGYPGDIIAVTERGANAPVTMARAADGSPARLQLPGDAGDYDIAYMMDLENSVLARVPVAIADSDYALRVPARADAGSTVEVDWTGPGYRGDFIAIAAEDAPDGRWLGYAYVTSGAKLALQMPSQPGRYELRYVLGQTRRSKAVAAIEVTAIDAALDAPPEAAAGASIEVRWTGPGYREDYVAIAEAGTPDDRNLSYVYTREGQPLSMTLPVRPGAYELRYIMSAGGRTLLARQPITVTEVQATLDAPDSAEAGSELTVGWTGPGYRNDYIEIVTPGRNGSIDFFYTREGATGTLHLPDRPGNYALRYVMGTGRTVIHSQPLRVD